MAAGVAGLVVAVVVMWAVVLPQARAWTVSCSNPYSPCYGMLKTCPPNCAQWCEVDCSTCNTKCACDRPGAVCQDPRFIGGDGIMFYFHGQKDADFCIVSDPALHINAHFIGKRGTGMTRDFTWVQSLGILFASHQLYVGAQTVSVWDNHVDALSLSLDASPIVLPPRTGASWELPAAGVKITRVEGKNAVLIELEGSFKLEAHVVPIGKQESRIHNYDITTENCFAHLELHFQFSNLSSEVHGVLGQTYTPGYKSPVDVDAPMPIMIGDHLYNASSLMSTDCTVSRFGSISLGEIITEVAPVSCGNARSGRGFVCRR